MIETDRSCWKLHAAWYIDDFERMGYGAMQLAGPGVWGPPRDIDAAIAVLSRGSKSPA